jgi:alkylation response protein AidB-like acyl-CoA dehydrogenase
MDVELSPDQLLVRDSVRRFLDERAPIRPYVRERIAATAITNDDPVWRGLGALDVVGLLVPEVQGGAGMGMVDAAVVLEELGRAVCPVPYVASAVGAVSLVVLAGGERERAFLLPDLARAATIGTVALAERGARYRWDAPNTTAQSRGDVWSLDGEKVHVPNGAGADLLLVVAAIEGAPGALGVFAVERRSAGVEAEPTPTVDGTAPEATIRLHGAAARPISIDGAVARAAIAATRDRMAVAYAIDGVGAASRALELAVEYAKEREQFGRPIGSFQAVQHLCADMLRAVELGRAVAYFACWALDAAEPNEAHRATLLARAYTADAFAQLGGTAIQVFGGIGFTWEHDIHLFYKRLLTNAFALGTADDHLAALADLVMAPAAE